MLLDGKMGGIAVAEAVSLDDIRDLALENAVEFERSYGELMVEMCQDEFRAYQESGDVDAINEGARIEKIKNWFKKMWEKIKSFFSKVMAKLRSWFSNNEAFYNKYKEDIAKGAAQVKDFKGFPYTPIVKEEIQKCISNAGATLKQGYEKNQVKDTKEVEGALDKIRGALCGAAEIKADNFSKALKEYLQGAEDKAAITMTVSEIEAGIVNYKLLTQKLAAEIKVTETLYKLIETNLSKAASEDKDGTTNAGAKLQVCQRGIALVNQFVSAALSARSAYSNQCKAYAYAAVKAAGKKSDDESNNKGDMDLDEAAAYLKEQGISL